MSEVQFQRGGARRPVPTVRDPLIQWASGLQTRSRTVYAGWMLEYGKDHDRDSAMEQAGFTHDVIKHGNGNMVDHWLIPTGNFFVLADGIESMGTMRQTKDRFGVAFGWQQIEGRWQSVLRMRVFLLDLLEQGYTEPCMVTLRGTVTADMVDILMFQYTQLDVLNGMRVARGMEPRDFPFYALVIPITAGEEVARGQDRTSRIQPPIYAMDHVLTREEAKALYIKQAWVDSIESLMDETIMWSVAQSQAIAAQTGTASTTDDLTPYDDRPYERSASWGRH